MENRLHTRRSFLRTMLKGAAALVTGGLGFTGYAAGIEPFRLVTTRWRLTPPGWPPSLPLRIAVLTDLHASEPWMTVDHIRHIVAETNAHAPDIVLLLGDFITRHRWVMRAVPDADWASAHARLHAPLGVHAVLGNHDWWAEPRHARYRGAKPGVRQALEAVGIPVYENTARRLEWRGQKFWLAGLGDQWAYGSRRRRGEPRRAFSFTGVDDLPATMAAITDDAPVILMAHEPDIFPQVPARVSLTLSGHTHGGQVQLFGFAPVIPSKYGRRYAYGHIVEEGRHIIVSSGLGCSTVPLRFGRPPEIAIIELGDWLRA